MDTSKLETYTMEDPTDSDRGENVSLDGINNSNYTLLAILPPHINLRYILQHPKYRSQYVDASSVKIKRNKYYGDLQKQYGPKVGDFVRVYRTPLDKELNTAFDPADYRNRVGEMGIVDDICPHSGVKINGGYYPFFILETLDKRDFEGKTCKIQTKNGEKELTVYSIFNCNGFTLCLFYHNSDWQTRGIHGVEFVKE